jgi:uncharacterized protein with GYD domain
MKTYFYQATISAALRGKIIQEGERFQEAMRVSVEAFGGRVIRCELSAAGIDPIGFLEFPDEVAASAWSTSYASREGVLTSQVLRLLDQDDLDKLKRLTLATKSTAAP